MNTGVTESCPTALSIGESPSKYPFLKNNGSEAPKGPRIHYYSGMDTYEDFLRLKIHHTLAPLFRYNKRFKSLDSKPVDQTLHNIFPLNFLFSRHDMLVKLSHGHNEETNCERC